MLPVWIILKKNEATTWAYPEDWNLIRVIYSKFLLLLILKNRYSFFPIINTSITIIKSQIIILSKAGLNHMVILERHVHMTFLHWFHSTSFTYINSFPHPVLWGYYHCKNSMLSWNCAHLLHFTINKSYIDNFSIFLLFILLNNPILEARLAFFNIWGDWLRLKVKNVPRCSQVSVA